MVQYKDFRNASQWFTPTSGISGMVVIATEGIIKGTCLYQGEEMVLVGEVEMEYVSDCDGLTSTRDGSLKESVGVSSAE